MSQQVLIFMPHDVLRAGIRAIFLKDDTVSDIYDIFSYEELHVKLASHTSFLVVIHQSLLRDIDMLPRGNFIVLALEPDVNVLQAAYRRGARGYFLEKVSEGLLRRALHVVEGEFLIEPALAPWMMEFISSDPVFARKHDVLTPREKEVADLLHEGFDRRTIAKQLSISDATLRTHIKNIMRKLKQNNIPLRQAVSHR